MSDVNADSVKTHLQAKLPCPHPFIFNKEKKIISARVQILNAAFKMHAHVEDSATVISWVNIW